MKTKNSFLVHSLSLLVCFLFIQTIGAIDLPLKKGDPGTIGGFSMIKKSATLSSTSLSLNVSADLTNSEITLDFTSPVGTAYVSIVDQSGNVVYQTVVDTYSTSEVVIPVDGLSTGTYSLKISYGTTHLIGNFQL
jgi:hypothetical protein